MKTTLKAWPAIAAATIGLCFLTQQVAALFGVELPDQQNVEVVRRWLLHAFDSTRNFATCTFLLAQILLLLPAVEELIFRMLLFKLPARLAGWKPGTSGGGGRASLPLVSAIAAAIPIATFFVGITRTSFPDSSAAWLAAKITFPSS